MNEENKNAGNSSNSESANNENSFKQDDTSVSGTGSNSESAPVSDDYYSVDYVKKDVISTIGDGEMHDEGLVGEGDLATDTPALQDLLSDEQEGAEMQDNEG